MISSLRDERADSYRQYSKKPSSLPDLQLQLNHFELTIHTFHYLQQHVEIRAVMGFEIDRILCRTQLKEHRNVEDEQKTMA